jgi:hypothetical protein
MKTMMRWSRNRSDVYSTHRACGRVDLHMDVELHMILEQASSPSCLQEVRSEVPGEALGEFWWA